MAHRSKRMKEVEKKVAARPYMLDEAVVLLKDCPPPKFDQTVDISIKLGIDPRKSDQQVRGTVSLPFGTGKTKRVLVFAQGEKVQEALAAGADFAGSTELLEKVKGGWCEFDAIISTPDLMREVGKLGKILGPKGLMPTPKAGSVTTDVAKAVVEVKGGKVEFKIDKHGVVANAVGKISFAKESIVENIRALLTAIVRAKPASAKGVYVQSLVLSTTMGPGLKIDSKEVPVL